MSCAMATTSDETDAKLRARWNGSMDPIEDMLEKELGGIPAVEYGAMGCALDKDGLCKP